MNFIEAYNLGVDFSAVPGEVFKIAKHKKELERNPNADIEVVDAMSGELLGIVDHDQLTEFLNKKQKGNI